LVLVLQCALILLLVVVRSSRLEIQFGFGLRSFKFTSRMALRCSCYWFSRSSYTFRRLAVSLSFYYFKA
jgi:hypothetical protein